LRTMTKSGCPLDFTVLDILIQTRIDFYVA
jgi:hypothetical protein